MTAGEMLPALGIVVGALAESLFGPEANPEDVLRELEELLDGDGYRLDHDEFTALGWALKHFYGNGPVASCTLEGDITGGGQE